jgi:hypothetical protein
MFWLTWKTLSGSTASLNAVSLVSFAGEGRADVLEGGPALTERGRVVVHLGDGAAVRLEAGGHRRVVPEECLDGTVGELVEVVALPVAAQCVALDAVLASLEVEVGQLHHAPIERPAEGRDPRPATSHIPVSVG